jgi:hypothetical protein
MSTRGDNVGVVSTLDPNSILFIAISVLNVQAHGEPLFDNREKNSKVFRCIPARDVAKLLCFHVCADEIWLEIDRNVGEEIWILYHEIA